jgi:hypothetical protein
MINKAKIACRTTNSKFSIKKSESQYKVNIAHRVKPLDIYNLKEEKI